MGGERELHVRVGLPGLGVEARGAARPVFARLLDHLLAEEGGEGDHDAPIRADDCVLFQPPSARFTRFAAAEPA